MTLYRIICYEPNEDIILYYEESNDIAPLIELFKKPLDEAYLLKVANAFSDASSLVITVEERTESTDWVKKYQRLEFLP